RVPPPTPPLSASTSSRIRVPSPACRWLSPSSVTPIDTKRLCCDLARDEVPAMITIGADGTKEVTPPLSDADAETRRAVYRLRITGVMYTARDAAHARLLPLIDAGKPLPIDVRGQIIYYTGPSPARPGDVVGSVGPTTGGRMDKFTPRLLALGLKGTIGQGARPQAR